MVGRCMRETMMNAAGHQYKRLSRTVTSYVVMYSGHYDERRRSPVQETKPDSDELRCGKGIIELIQCKTTAYDRMRRGGSCKK
ncbi:hypothetical protein J6590_056549 [Homalodisca vitripennis]|nr:hypothetical protein J6590_056549 [Homalodisca vitripennis]